MRVLLKGMRRAIDIACFVEGGCLPRHFPGSCVVGVWVDPCLAVLHTVLEVSVSEGTA
jgi:hypothetical protein